MNLDTSKGPFKFYKTGASAFTNKHMIVDYWILNCKQPAFGGVDKDKFSARIINHNGAWETGHVHWMASLPGKQDLYIDAKASSPSYRIQRGVYNAGSHGNKQIKFNPAFPAPPVVVLTSLADGRHGNTCIAPKSVTANGFTGRMIHYNGQWDKGKIMWVAIHKTAEAGRRKLGETHTEDDYNILLNKLTGLQNDFGSLNDRMKYLEELVAKFNQ